VSITEKKNKVVVRLSDTLCRIWSIWIQTVMGAQFNIFWPRLLFKSPAQQISSNLVQSHKNTSHECIHKSPLQIEGLIANGFICKESFTNSSIWIANSFKSESIWCNVFYENKDYFIVDVCYHSPDSLEFDQSQVLYDIETWEEKRWIIHWNMTWL